MAVITGVAKTSKSFVKEFDFRKNDVAIAGELTFTSGAGTRRKKYNATAPLRKNWCQHARSFADWETWADVTVTSNVENNPFDNAATVDQVVFDAVPNARIMFTDSAITIANGDTVSFAVDIWSATDTTINIAYVSSPSFEWSTEDTIAVTAGWNRYLLPALVSGLTTDTNMRVYIITRDSVARTLKLDRAHLYKGNASYEPFIEGETSDWPRINYVNNGSTPSAGGWTTDGLAVLSAAPDKLGPTGKIMSKLSQNGGGYAYSYMNLPALPGLLKGMNLVYRGFFRVGDRANKVINFGIRQYPGALVVCSIVANAETGVVTLGAGHSLVSYDLGGGLFGFEVKGTIVQDGITVVDLVLGGDENGKGHYFGTLEVVHDQNFQIGDIIDNGNLGNSTIVTRPPFGEFEEVVINSPRINYNLLGLPDGLRIDGAISNLLESSENAMDDLGWWVNNNLLSTTTIVAPDSSNTGRKLVSSFNGPGARGFYQIGKTISAGVHSGSVFVKASEIEWFYLSLYDSTGNHFAWYHIPSRTIGTVASGFQAYIEPAAFGFVRIGLEGILQSGTNAGIAVGLTTGDTELGLSIPAFHGAYFWGSNFGPGKYSSYLFGNDPSSRVADHCYCDNLSSIGLSGDEWTVVIDIDEPAPDTTPGYPMLLRIEGDSGSVFTLNKQPNGTIEFQGYDGSTNIASTFAGTTTGTRRKYALSFSRTQGRLRAVGTDGSITETTSGGPLLAFPTQNIIRFGSAASNWHINSTIHSVKTFDRFLSERELLEQVTIGE